MNRHGAWIADILSALSWSQEDESDRISLLLGW